ncbi:MAG: hypothetical protein EBS18_01805, partial [Actinobacteria bacterium]|nr:hypothetical protein [Actinomycetota bacterium]
SSALSTQTTAISTANAAYAAAVSANEKAYQKALVDNRAKWRSDIEKIDKQSRKSVVWSESEITTIFIIKKIGGVWELSDTR